MAQQKQIAFNSIRLLKNKTLGIGSYGKVCKAKCDDLLCAAKLIHETLFDPTAQQQIESQREHRLPMRRFEQECEFLSTIRHPNIVQYLGIYRDPDTGLPALLMELMDDSLTHFLESSPQPIPYHIQINICHDITLALSFLHSNSIVHRDLSSNNVLLIGNVRAKVTDFGMARLGDQNPRATQLTFIMCPGTDVYMPPEAIKDKPVYTEKIDCFSFGVIIVQIVTRQFPKPEDRRKEIQCNQPGLPPIVEVPIPELERRQNHIDEIDPDHPLKQIALDCLKDRDVERPSAQQLCERVAALKEDRRYSESVKVIESRSTAKQNNSDERDRELRSLRQQYIQQIQGLQQIIQPHISHLLAEKDQTIARKEQTITQNSQMMREKEEMIAQKEDIIAKNDEVIAEVRQESQQLREKVRELTKKVEEIDRLERQLGCVNQQLRESERDNARFQGQIAELKQLRPATDASCSSKEQRASIKLKWREGEKAPCEMNGSYCATVDVSTLYIRQIMTDHMLCYTISSSSWSRLPDCPTYSYRSVIINNLLTVVGGYDYGGVITNRLFSLTGEGSGRKWTEEFPPMPTKRYGTIALCSETALIVGGGNTVSELQTVEVMNTETLQWSTAAALPQPLSHAPASISGNRIFILGESNMFTCSLQALIESCTLRSFLPRFRNRIPRVWKEVAVPPVTNTSCVSICDQLLAIGGKDSDGKSTSAIHVYNPTTDSWEVISHMGTPRYNCIAAALPYNQLMVVGGYTTASDLFGTKSVEFASN